MAVTRQERRLIEQCADLATVECCGHDQQAKVGSEEPLRFTTESKSQVSLDAALMEFIENDDSIGLKRRILLQQPGQQPPRVTTSSLVFGPTLVSSRMR